MAAVSEKAISKRSRVMKCRYNSRTIVNCAVMVGKHGFLASARMFDVSHPGSPPVSPETLTPGTIVRLEIAPEGRSAVTVEQGLVRWVQEFDLEVTIIRMPEEEKKKIDMLIRSSAQSDASLLCWFWRFFRGDVGCPIYLSFEPIWFQEDARLLEAA